MYTIDPQRGVGIISHLYFLDINTANAASDTNGPIDTSVTSHVPPENNHTLEVDQGITHLNVL